MKKRKIHRILGLVMLLPLLAWASTGVIFLTKPGYDQAYERLLIKTYDLESKWAITPRKGWEEVRLLESVLGPHLLVKVNGEFKHFDPNTLAPAGRPNAHEVKQLINDAIKANTSRYGSVERVEGSTAYTTTGVQIQLNWDQMQLSQRGDDRALIETFYKIHYLQWTKWEGVNLALGVIGLSSLFALSVLGFLSFMSRERKVV